MIGWLRRRLVAWLLPEIRCQLKSESSSFLPEFWGTLTDNSGTTAKRCLELAAERDRNRPAGGDPCQNTGEFPHRHGLSLQVSPLGSQASSRSRRL